MFIPLCIRRQTYVEATDRNYPVNIFSSLLNHNFQMILIYPEDGICKFRNKLKIKNVIRAGGRSAPPPTYVFIHNVWLGVIEKEWNFLTCHQILYATKRHYFLFWKWPPVSTVTELSAEGIQKNIDLFIYFVCGFWINLCFFDKLVLIYLFMPLFIIIIYYLLYYLLSILSTLVLILFLSYYKNKYLCERRRASLACFIQPKSAGARNENRLVKIFKICRPNLTRTKAQKAWSFKKPYDLSKNLIIGRFYYRPPSR